ncbi:aldo/keto reductase [Sphingopyxis sp.]|uniref:aldo/keto reductase n=1 Tax=Sphingopyxis sp. TaxID=1908224 RepID=UPI003D6D3A8B
MTRLLKPLRSRPLGNSGPMVSALAWGMMRFHGDDVPAARALVDAVLATGITLFDTADIYGRVHGEDRKAETLLGQVFSEDRSLRDRIVLATKGGIVSDVPYDSSATHIEAAIDVSLKRLQVDRVDLWQIHRPDILTHPSEIARALDKAHALGKIAAVGVSNYTVAQTEALRLALPHDLKLTSIQPEFSALQRDPIETGLLDAALVNDYAVLAWSPLAGGRVATPGDDREHAVAAALDVVANEQGTSRSAVALSWIMAHPARPIPIIGSQTPARIADCADALHVEWTRADWYDVLAASRGEKLP